jgi:predicted permease
MNLRDLKLRVTALIARRRAEQELDEELAFHLAREAEKLIASGMSPSDARTAARARFGSVTVSADECRDARGIVFVDDLVRDVLYALRAFRRAPLFALTVVTTVAFGLAVLGVLFTFFNVAFLRVDNVLNPDELFAVERPTRPGADSWVAFTRPEYEALRAETSAFSDVFGRTGVDTRIDGRLMHGSLVTGNFFQVLGVTAARGRTLVPEDDVRFAGRPVIVLSHRGWERHFATDPGVVGRSLLVNGVPHAIVGVTPEGFRGLVIGGPDYWAPLSSLAQFRPQDAGREETVGIEVIGRLKPGMSRQTAIAGLVVWAAGRATPHRVDRQAAANITLRRRDGTSPDDVLEGLLLFVPTLFAFGLILFIGCTNVANLLLARGVARQREIGIRLSLGASRRRVLRQLLTESLLLSVGAAAVGLLMAHVILVGSFAAVSNTIPPEIAEMVGVSPPDLDWRVLGFMIVASVVATALFGLAPALQATRIELVRTIRGDITKNARPGCTRNVLIGAQVTASALLLICAAVFLRSAMSSATADPGVRTDDTLFVDIVNEPMRAAMVNGVTAEPLVATVAASFPDERQALANKQAAAYRFVSSEYFSVLGIPILHGRAFTPAEAASRAAVAVISETAARRLWPNGNAVGRELRLEDHPAERRRSKDDPSLASNVFSVVGVARDIRRSRLSETFSDTGVYVPTTTAQAGTSLVVRVHGDPQIARRALLRRLTAIDPGMGQIMTMRTIVGTETYMLQIAFWVTVVLGGLALMLTVSGLFSVLSYIVEQRTKEIGVRMAMGATPRTVARLVLSQLARPVTLGLVVGGSLAAALAAVLMAMLGPATLGNIVHVFDPLAYAGSILTIIAACAVAASIPALRAARIDPMRTLRQE